MNTRKDLLVMVEIHEETIRCLLDEIKRLKYELHIARTSAILLKHSMDGGYD